MDFEETVIIGGGLAGLSAAVHLAEKGGTPLLLEAGKYPLMKMCGEFFSPEVAPLLQNLNLLPSQEICQVAFILKGREYLFDLPKPARTESRYTFDQKLAKLAEKKGARIHTGVAVKSIEGQTVHLDNEVVIHAKNLIIGTGRVIKCHKPSFPYMGFKAHVQGGSSDQVLRMHLVPGGYIGVSSIGGGMVNIAGVVKKEYFQEPDAYQLVKERPDWMVSPVPEFGLKELPLPPHVFYVGDAMGTVPPILGDGLSMSLLGGKMVTDYVIKGDAHGYATAWRQRYQKRIRLGMFLHKLAMQQPKLFLQVAELFPALFRFLFNQTREKVSG